MTTLDAANDYVAGWQAARCVDRHRAYDSRDRRASAQRALSVISK
jgi:hypothetical protein